MSKEVIKVENLSKQYRLGTVGTGSLAHDINRTWHRLRGKEDPYLMVGEVNDRSQKGVDAYVWALKEVNFNIREGEVVGVIGKNGAGKSTLLKILSRTTAPTTGSVKMRGRVASLLEVGTGFHPELTGRDNIFLNGAILGMNRSEVKRKFDEIVDFSGVEKYIDTPVKRYSSGMYVRLAFAVSAHLEPDILIVDEVLAVGDVEFQKRCLGKMKDVSQKQGRTILFVSHNMTAIKNICEKTLYLQYGRLVAEGSTDMIIKKYLANETIKRSSLFFESETAAIGNLSIKVKSIFITPIGQPVDQPLTVNTPVNVEIEFWNYVSDRLINVSLHLNTLNYECVFNVGTTASYLTVGLHKAVCSIPGNLLNDGDYVFRIIFVADKAELIFDTGDVVGMQINESREESDWHGKWPGFVRPNLNFVVQ